MNVAVALTQPVSLRRLARHHKARVVAIDWHHLSAPEARRLRELGLDEGVEVEMLHASGLMGGPIACRIGRMQVALRRHVADAVHVQPVAL